MKKLPAEINWQIKLAALQAAFCLSSGQLTGSVFQGFASDPISLTLMINTNPECMNGCQNHRSCPLRLREFYRNNSTNICSLYILYNHLCCSTILCQKVEEIALKSQSCNVNKAKKESESGNLPVLVYFNHSSTTLMFLIIDGGRKRPLQKFQQSF